MSASLSIVNYSSQNIAETTNITADALAGASSISVISANNLLLNDFVVIGRLGSEQAELRKLGTPSGLSLPITAALTGKHLANDPVAKLFGDKIRIYRAANANNLQPADSDFTVLATVDIDPDQAQTEYIDPAGSSAYWYKYVYYNSVANLETPLADSTAGRGGTSYYCSIDDARGEAGFKNAPYITDALISAKVVAAQAEIDSTLGSIYSVPFSDPVNPFIADICQRLAAGLLLAEQYGENSSNADSKIKGARADLQKLVSGGMTLRNTAGTSLVSGSATGGVSGWPNSTTAGMEPGAGAGDFSFRMSDTF